ncbi:MAG TPA: hypothetical protein VMS11_07310 [Solirubrobacterales bacterium]|nr:hypothetical protein [Solirubrobacterales bacterium]
MTQHRLEIHVSPGEHSSLYLPKCVPCRWLGGDCRSEEEARQEFEERHLAGREFQGDPDHWGRPTS